MRHLDGDQRNNTWDNIAIGTQSDNCMDMPPEIRIAKASRAGRSNSPLADKDVLDIRVMLAEGATQQEIADKYGISTSTVSNIKHKKFYKYL